MEKSESIIELSKALAKFHQEVKQPFKDADNPFFKSKYVPLENVVESIDTAAPNNGLSYVQWPVSEEDRIGVVTMITHSSGEFMQFDPIFMKPEKVTPQGAGSTITYLKRYALSAVFGITSDQDDDGNQASGNNSPPKNAIKPKQVGIIKTKVDRLAKLRNVKDNDIYSHLKVKNIEKLNEQQATQMIETLDKWTKQADKEQGAS